MVSRAAALFPIASIHSGEGPIKTRLLSAHARAKSEFSAKNPYPGCIACAPVLIAAAIIDDITK